MKAITIAQPWASLVAVGEKLLHAVDFDTNYRGPVAIFAAPEKTDSNRQTASNRPFATLLFDHGLDYETLPYGKIIAIAGLVDVVNHPDTIRTRPGFINRQERKLSSPHHSHSTLLVFSSVVPLAEPVAEVDGGRGLWDTDWDLAITRKPEPEPSLPPALVIEGVPADTLEEFPPKKSRK